MSAQDEFNELLHFADLHKCVCTSYHPVLVNSTFLVCSITFCVFHRMCPECFQHKSWKAAVAHLRFFEMFMVGNHWELEAKISLAQMG